MNLSPFKSRVRFIAGLASHPIATLRRPLWIDLDQPHKIACREHRDQLARPSFADPRGWRAYTRERGIPECEVE